MTNCWSLHLKGYKNNGKIDAWMSNLLRPRLVSWHEILIGTSKLQGSEPLDPPSKEFSNKMVWLSVCVSHSGYFCTSACCQEMTAQIKPIKPPIVHFVSPLFSFSMAWLASPFHVGRKESSRVHHPKVWGIPYSWNLPCNLITPTWKKQLRQEIFLNYYVAAPASWVETPLYSTAIISKTVKFLM